MIAYDGSAWSDLFVASAGASAALAGLVFVAVSINVERILQFSDLPDRALATVLLLLSVLLVSIIGLIPGQGHVALGGELLGEALVLGGAVAFFTRRSLPPRSEPRSWQLGRTAVMAAGTLPLVIGAVGVLAQTAGGLYWTVAGMVFAVAGAVANAWVLLVEILR